MNTLCPSSNSCSSKDARRSRAAAKVLKEGYLFKERHPPQLPPGEYDASPVSCAFIDALTLIIALPFLFKGSLCWKEFFVFTGSRERQQKREEKSKSQEDNNNSLTLTRSKVSCVT